MYFEVEPTGCSEYKGTGLVEIRFDFFLDPDDYGFDRTYIDLPDIPEGIVFKPKEGSARADYKVWLDSFPKKKTLTPFQLHFIRVLPDDATPENLAVLGGRLLKEAYSFWEQDQPPAMSKSTAVQPVATHDQMVACVIAVDAIKAVKISSREQVKQAVREIK